MQRKGRIGLGIGVGVALILGIAGFMALSLQKFQRQEQNRKRLFAAIEHHDTNAVRTLLGSGTPGDVRRRISTLTWMDMLKVALHLQPTHSQFGSSALGEAAFSSEDPEMIRLLLKHGARADDPKDGILTFALGALSGQPVPEIVQLLLEHGADPNLRLPFHKSPLWFALGHDGPEVGRLTKILLDHGADPLQPESDTPQTRSYLSSAILSDHTRIVAAMLDHGVDIQARDNYVLGKGSRPMTPLATAIFAGHLDMVKMLLARGARIEPLDGEGLIGLAVHNHDEHFLKALKAKGVSIESKTWLGMTPLMSVSYDDSNTSGDPKRRITEMETLLAHGANINARNKDGQTPLIVSCWSKKNLPQLKFLLAHGSDPNARDARGVTGLYYAAAGGGGEPTVSYLLAHGANARMTYSQGYTLLMGAAINLGDPRIVAPLVAAGCDLKARDKKGNTALMLARQHHHTAFVQALTKAGATR